MWSRRWRPEAHNLSTILPDVEAEAAPPRRVALAVSLLILLLVGWGLVLGVARSQSRVAERSPWARSLILVGPEPEFSPQYPLVFRRLEGEDLPQQDLMLVQLTAELRKTADGREFIDALGLERHEFVNLLDLPAEQWPTLLESGRLPAPGAREVLRGAMARFDRFTLDGEAFQVVGRLRRDLPGLGFGYVLPDERGLRQTHFSGTSVKQAWLLPEGKNLVESGQLDLVADDAPDIISPLAPAPPRDPRITILGLALMAIGGSGLQVLAMARLSRRRVPVFGPVLKEIASRPRLVMFFHAAYYGLFFLMMWVMIGHPLWGMRLNSLLDRSFESGMLGYVRESYASGNVAQAAFATWLWNYGIATLGMVFLPSLVPVLGALFGLGKTALSFGVVGCAMSPLWVGMPETLVYHSGTMVLELEAYIITAFVVTVFTGYVVWGLATLNTTGKTRLLHGLKVFVGGAVLVGLMLALAGLYEATTIVAFGGLSH